MTLWHLLTRGSPEERARVYDRLAALVPPPQDVTRELILAGEPRGAEPLVGSAGRRREDVVAAVQEEMVTT